MQRIDAKVEKEDKALLLLTSLPNSYDTLVTTLLYGKDTVSLKQVQLALVSHYTQKNVKVLKMEKVQPLQFKVGIEGRNLMVDLKGATGPILVPEERVYNAIVVKNLVM